MIYLYLKTHKKTGIKYFGKTEQDPYLYEGSGKKWKTLLLEHGKEHETEILFSSKSIDEVKKYAEEYSITHDISNNPVFANMIEEGGGYFMGGKANPNYKHGKSVGWKSDKRVQKEFDKVRNAEYHAQNKDKEQARMKCRYYAIKRDKNKSKKWYAIWKSMSTKSIPDFETYYSKNSKL